MLSPLCHVCFWLHPHPARSPNSKVVAFSCMRTDFVKPSDSVIRVQSTVYSRVWPLFFVRPGMFPWTTCFFLQPDFSFEKDVNSPH